MWVEDAARVDRLRLEGERVALAGHRVVLSAWDQELADRIGATLLAAGLGPPSISELLGPDAGERADRIVDLLVAAGDLVRLPDGRLFHAVALTELLYMVPPLYHINLDEFDRHRDIMKRHDDFFSPLHREFGFAQMTYFCWLSSDRMLQRTVFGDKVELVANFSQESRRYQGIEIPGRSVLAKWTEDGDVKILTFTPNLIQSVE